MWLGTLTTDWKYLPQDGHLLPNSWLVSSRTEQEEVRLTSRSRETPERRGLDLTKNVRGEDGSNIALPESVESDVRND